jgi:FlaA1/EpsC-like NDP-sugar epimerase
MSIFVALYRLHIIPFLKKWNLLNVILGAIDIFSIALAFQGAYMLNFYQKGGLFFQERNLLVLFLVLLPVWIVIMYLIKVAEIPRTKRYRVLFFEYLQSAIIFFFVFTSIYFIFDLYPVPRLFIIELIIFGIIFLFGARLLEYKVFKIYRAQGYNFINVVLIADESAIHFIERLLTYKEWGYKIFAIFTDSDMIREKYEKTIIVLPGKFMKVLNDLMEVDLIDEVLYVKGRVIPSEVREMIRSCEEIGVTCKLRIKESKVKLTNAFKSEIGEDMFLTFSNIPHNPYHLAIKKLMDIFVSLTSYNPFFPVAHLHFNNDKAHLARTGNFQTGQGGTQGKDLQPLQIQDNGSEC